jgi:oxidoreductase, NAD-binding domain protein
MPKVCDPNGILHTLESRTLTIAQHGNYGQFYEDFYQALIGKKENPVPASEALEVINIIDELANRQIS